METTFIGYCGIYCGSCAFKAKVIPAASILYDEMRKGGFEDVVDFMPDGTGFWRFLKGTVDSTEASCRRGCGDPGCKIRICAKERGVEICTSCAEYPCGLLDEFFLGRPVIKEDNDVLREKGMEAWMSMQKERRARGFVYFE